MARAESKMIMGYLAHGRPPLRGNRIAQRTIAIFLSFCGGLWNQIEHLK